MSPRTVADVFSSPTCSIAAIRKNIPDGEIKVKALVLYALADIIEQLNVGKTMNDTQLGRATELVIEEYYFLKPDDFKLCFNRVMKGVYGQTYDRVDVQVIFGWLDKYVNDRHEEAAASTCNEHNSNSKCLGAHPDVTERIKSLLKPKTDDETPCD